MARTRAQSTAQMGHVSSALRDRGKRPLGIQKPRTPRRTRQQQRTAHHHKQQSPAVQILPQKVSATPGKRGTKRLIDAGDDDLDGSHKRPRRSPRSSAAEVPLDRLATRYSGINEPANPIAFWASGGQWPRYYFEPEMERLLAQKMSLPSLNRKRSNSNTSTTPSDQKPREEKSAQYRDPRYETLLGTRGSFMAKSRLGITTRDRNSTKTLLESKQTVPKDTLFRDDIFESTCQKMHNRNEARVIQDISRLIVPSAESLATFGAKHLDVLTESVNEGWNNSIPLTVPRPQPDYSVGFKREAFSDEQLAKLSPFIGDFIAGDKSLFMATYYMYFPFLSCEVKCGAAALDVADRQNAHSMTLAVRAVAELFRAVKREDEVHRQILAFSISHDHCTVRIYGHYPVIDGKDVKYYRHPIHKFDFTALEGREKWTAYQFTRNVYDMWMPSYFKKICSAIDQLPSDFDFDNPSLPETRRSQGLESHYLSQSDMDLVPVEEDSHSSAAKQAITPSTSYTDKGTAKKRKGGK